MLFSQNLVSQGSPKNSRDFSGNAGDVTLRLGSDGQKLN